MLRDIQLPETLRAAIEAKQKAEQESLQMQYVLAKERQEAEHKHILAERPALWEQLPASFSVASIPFHCSSCSLIPAVTIRAARG